MRCCIGDGCFISLQVTAAASSTDHDNVLQTVRVSCELEKLQITRVSYLHTACSMLRGNTIVVLPVNDLDKSEGHPRD